MPNAPDAGDSRDPFHADPSTVMTLAKDAPAERGFKIQALARHDAQSAVGRALHARGLDVRLVVYQDTIGYQAEAQIVVANPRRPERGQVSLGDNAGTIWEWSCPDPLIGTTDAATKLIVRVLADAADLAKLP